MDVTFLIDAIVRETTVLTAQLAGYGRRATLAHAADQLLSSVTQELRSRGPSNKGVADLFGVSLRTFHNRVSRLSESRTEPGHALWEALYTYIDLHGPLTLPAVLHRFAADGKAGVLGVLKDLVASGLVFARVRMRALCSEWRAPTSIHALTPRKASSAWSRCSGSPCTVSAQ